MPGKDVVYFDTSALAKWYLNESFSAHVSGTVWRTVRLDQRPDGVEMRISLRAAKGETNHPNDGESRLLHVEDYIRQAAPDPHAIPATTAAGAVNLHFDSSDFRSELDAMHLVVARETILDPRDRRRSWRLRP